ncbi:DUF3916 domain-containing protein [Acerihabitans sp. KWT182]|uniref:DUF3916 domain-containing protein n=1 Tax=Acerihabitans sp. KWT182 TaxID=3157919 RepID=A0AAU7QDJ5_9GAMM
MSKHMSRRLSRDYRTKIRNIPRSIKALNHWAETFHNPERANFSEDQHYCNYKIPVETNLVQGKYSDKKTKAACAQALINACSNLMRATENANDIPRITAAIYLPDMFVSEVCLFRSEEYFQSFISEGSSETGSTVILRDRSLAKEWGLILPEGVQELGIRLEYHGGDDPDEWFTGEYWYYGQLE